MFAHSAYRLESRAEWGVRSVAAGAESAGGEAGERPRPGAASTGPRRGAIPPGVPPPAPEHCYGCVDWFLYEGTGHAADDRRGSA